MTYPLTQTPCLDSLPTTTTTPSNSPPRLLPMDINTRLLRHLPDNGNASTDDSTAPGLMAGLAMLARSASDDDASTLSTFLPLPGPLPLPELLPAA